MSFSLPVWFRSGVSGIDIYIYIYIYIYIGMFDGHVCSLLLISSLMLVRPGITGVYNPTNGTAPGVSQPIGYYSCNVYVVYLSIVSVTRSSRSE